MTEKKKPISETGDLHAVAYQARFEAWGAWHRDRGAEVIVAGAPPPVMTLAQARAVRAAIGKAIADAEAIEAKYRVEEG